MVLQHVHVNSVTQGVDSKTSHVHTVRERQRDDNGSMKDVLSVGVLGGFCNEAIEKCVVYLVVQGVLKVIS